MKNKNELCFLVIVLLFGIIFIIPVQGSANWWDKFGEPEYGDRLVLCSPRVGIRTDLYNMYASAELQFWKETLFMRDLSLDRQVWPFISDYTPEKYYTGLLAESWEQPDFQTVIIHLRNNVFWHDKAPLNGRQFTASDVEYHFDRLMGTGHGFTEPASAYSGFIGNWEKVKALDDYTVEIRFKAPSSTGLISVMDTFAYNQIEARELVDQDLLKDWKDAVGTGPWILSDFVEGSSQTYKKYSKYWGFDPRYPEKPVPYTDEVKILCIPDTATLISGVRTAKIDIVPVAMFSGVNWRQAKDLQKTNPNLRLSLHPQPSESLTFRVDKKPFTDINVRKAMNMAIDRKVLAEQFYDKHTDGTPVGMVSRELKGYCYAYEDWPQELKDEYAYNPGKARKLLADAGYPKGFKTSVISATGFYDVELLKVYKAFLSEIGVDMEIDMNDMGVCASITSSGKHTQMVSDGLAGLWAPYKILEKRTSKSMANNPTWNNDPVYDKLADIFYASATPEAAAQAMRNADKYAIEKHWSVYGIPVPKYTVSQPYIKGYSGEYHFQWGAGYLLARIWIDKAKKVEMH